jgi:hypothetical protein
MNVRASEVTADRVVFEAGLDDREGEGRQSANSGNQIVAVEAFVPADAEFGRLGVSLSIVYGQRWGCIVWVVLWHGLTTPGRLDRLTALFGDRHCSVESRGYNSVIAVEPPNFLYGNDYENERRELRRRRALRPVA